VGLLSGVELGVEEGIESVLAGGVDVSDDGALLLGGALDCIELSEAGADVSGPTACCREQAEASVSALRDRINKPRFIGHLAVVGWQISRPLHPPGVSVQRVIGRGVPSAAECAGGANLSPSLGRLLQSDRGSRGLYLC
jgi:hypothetical protein